MNETMRCQNCRTQLYESTAPTCWKCGSERAALSPSDAAACSPRVVWVAISNVNGCALLVEDGDQSGHEWPGVTWKRFVEENATRKP